MIKLLTEIKKRCGKRRCSDWAKIRAEYLKANPFCRACGATEKLEVHHIKPFHLFPEQERDNRNFVTLCEGNGHDNCHHRWGHHFDWKKFNSFVTEQADWVRENFWGKLK